MSEKTPSLVWRTVRSRIINGSSPSILRGLMENPGGSCIILRYVSKIGDGCTEVVSTTNGSFRSTTRIAGIATPITIHFSPRELRILAPVRQAEER